MLSVSLNKTFLFLSHLADVCTRECQNGAWLNKRICRCDCLHAWSGHTCGMYQYRLNFKTLSENAVQNIFLSLSIPGAGRSSEVERSLMVRWVVGSILHGVDPLSYFSFQPVLHDWCTKGRGMCYPLCGMVHIKEPLLLIGKSSLCGSSGFPSSLSEWSLTICLTRYNRK